MTFIDSNNHLQVEIQLTRELYNKELDRLHSLYKQQITKLEQTLEEQKQTSSSLYTEKNMAEKVEAAVEEINNSWRQRLAEVESQYMQEKMTHTDTRDRMIKLQNELTGLRERMSHSSKMVSDQLADKDSEIEKLRNMSKSMERSSASKRDEYSKKLEENEALIVRQQEELAKTK